LPLTGNTKNQELSTVFGENMLIVQKYGGTSVGSIERIRAVAEQIIQSKKGNNQVVVVLSAMAGETNRLIELASNVSKSPNPHHTDMLVSTGEQISIALMSMTLEQMGVKAKPFLGHQVKIQTDEHHSKARITKIETNEILKALDNNIVPIIAGFQGISKTGAITTIGRGGSDTSAVAVAAALNASSCEIMTDVEGVYTADPRICGNAKKLHKISYEELMEFADAGAKVMHARAVEIAARNKVPLCIRSSFTNGEGTWVVPEEEIMEDTLISGITMNIDEAKVAIRSVPDEIGVVAKIFEPIAKAGINVDLILQNLAANGHHDLTFTVPKEDLKKAIAHAEGAAREVGAGRVEAAGDIAKISVVGVGMRSHAGVAHKMFDTLAKHGISIQMIGTSEIKVSIVIDIKYSELAVRVLHEAFELSKKDN
jgi:aspartate kinase